MVKVLLMIACVLNINYFLKKCLIARLPILQNEIKEFNKYMINVRN